MNKELIVAVACVIVAIAMVGFTVYLFLKEQTLDSLRAEVYQLFLKAEHLFLETDSGQRKMNWVIQQIHLIMPNWLKFFLSEETLKALVQMWFDCVKDLLDDGKANKSIEVEE